MIKLKDLITEVSGATRMSEKEWTMIHSKLKPNKNDKIDINKAINTLNKLGKYNFSQGTVVRNKKVIAIEGKGGTEKMLRKCKNKKIR